jgi:zinc/manganese transport system ATP-binding protein
MTRTSTGADSAPSGSFDAEAQPGYLGGAAPEREAVIFCDHAGVRLGGRTLWHDLTFEAYPGEFIALLGPNGAGKSTLLKVLLGLLAVSEGSVRVLGASVRRGNASVGYLPQRRSFEADVRVRGRDVVRLGLDGGRWGLPLPGVRRLWGGDAGARKAAARVDEVIELVGASHYAHRPIGELSGGEQQRLLIAQALVTRPRILLLDEPLESLDLNNQQTVSALIGRVSREQQVTVLLVAHDVNPILSSLDRVLYLGRSQTAIGTPQEVLTSETLSRLYAAPIEVLHTRDGRIVVVGQPGEVSDVRKLR